jgi:4-amino-4-deoxy-L-arabinose transferase-like glycosyltransferase
MSILDKIKTKHIFFLFIFLHVLLFGVNAAEWGDSYRILRAAEYVRKFTYPVDEKRPPLFSIILAVRPSFVDQVIWGRIIVFAFSAAAFVVFLKLCNYYLKGLRARKLALLLFALNPVYLYWSIRIMADVPFSFLILATIYLFTVWRGNLTATRSAFLGILVGLSVLLRFEGYILFGAVGLGLAFSLREHKHLKTLLQTIPTYVACFGFTILPYLYFRNPFDSSYLDEPSGRTYDLKMVLIYVVSLMFVFGFTQAYGFFVNNTKRILVFLLSNVAILTFVVIELILILLWPAAIPRLFIPIIPLLIIPLAQGMVDFFDTLKRQVAGLGAFLLVVFIISQYLFKLQFLVPIKPVFIVVSTLQLIAVYCLYKRSANGFFAVTLLSLALWSFSAIWVHKDIFIAVKSGAIYAAENLTGVVGYNDVSSVSDWYLNQRDPTDRVAGVYYHYDKKEDLAYESLLDKGYNYLLMTNEHNTDMTLDIESRDYLRQIKEFRYLINGKVFWAKVIEVM